MHVVRSVSSHKNQDMQPKCLKRNPIGKPGTEIVLGILTYFTVPLAFSSLKI